MPVLFERADKSCIGDDSNGDASSSDEAEIVSRRTIALGLVPSPFYNVRELVKRVILMKDNENISNTGNSGLSL